MAIAPVVVVPCGQKKQNISCRADQMYIGSYHRACLYYARTLTTPDRIYILSAKYGLILPSEIIEPYEQRVKQSDKRFWSGVFDKVAECGLESQPAVLLGGYDYTAKLGRFWAANRMPFEVPLCGVGGMGQQLSWLRNQIKTRKAFTVESH